MTHIADRFVIILDANVLYPFRVRDALLRFNEAGLFRARWTDAILDEWQNAVLRDRPDRFESLKSQREAMADAFDEAWVEGYEPIIEGLTLPDPDDRHVLAAAIRCGAQHIVTENVKGFPAEVLAAFGIEAVSADAVLANTFELYEPEASSALHPMRRAYRRPEMSPGEFLKDLTRVGLPKLSFAARPYIDAI